MEGHTCLNNGIILVINHKLILLELEANTETKIIVTLQIGILRGNIIHGSMVCFFDRAANLEILCQNLLSFKCNVIGLLLHFIRVDDQSAGDHGGHVTIFTTAINVDGGRF